MTYLPPHVSAWAIERVKRDPRLAAEISAAARRLKRDYPRMTPEERTLRADPITIGTAIFAAVGVAASTTAAAIVGAAVLIGASIAVNYAVAALTQKSKGSGSLGNSADQVGAASINSPAIKYNERQPIPSKRIIYGTAQVGGALFFEQVKAPFLFQGFLICAKQVTAFRKVWIGSQQISFSTLSPDAVLTPLGITGQPNYPERLAVSFRLGSRDQAADLLLQDDELVKLSGSNGTPIGTLTRGAGLAAAFDGVVYKPFASCAATTLSTTGYIGKDWGVGVSRKIAYFVFTMPTDARPVGTLEFYLEGSNDNFATVTTLAHVPPATYDGGESKAVQSGIDTSTAYRFHRLRIVASNAAAGPLGIVTLAQLVFYELVGAVLPYAEFRQRGIATAVLRYHYGIDYNEFTQLWGQVQRPSPYFLVDGVALPDPRQPGHILDWDPSDPDSVAEAEASWSWSNNAALVQTHYLTQRYGGRINPSRINWDKVARAADWDDGLVACKDGTFIKRHTIDGVVTLNQSPADVMGAMISANRGFVLESAGKMWPSSSVPRSAVAAIRDELLTGAIEYRAAKPKRDMANRVKVRFVAQEREYQTADGPVLDRADLRAADGELLDATLELPFTMDHRRAQRLQKAFLETARLGRQIVCTCDVALLAECADDLIGSAVTFDSVLFAQANGTYLCTEWGFADNFASIALTLIEYDASIETDYLAANDEQPFVLADLTVS
ncbi:hypothetical protein [Bradyrhizobium sp. 153]|uniref:hypothetical protein n=1 Tax=Bradyrhizobium sp. 153 TaxID=2782627 RepID=UPI001FF99C08|nr:hypothetical protein [Bradyrhizobium sp. 153]MCK1669445.1 hypothetical protein [Bradyrhizobium sp. 153]